jgi:hypothetical protein
MKRKLMKKYKIEVSSLTGMRTIDKEFNNHEQAVTYAETLLTGDVIRIRVYRLMTQLIARPKLISTITR